MLGSLNRGGTEILMLDVLSRYKTAPFEMVLIYRREGELSNEFLQCGCRLFRIDPQHIMRFPGYLLKVRKLIKYEKISVIHTHQRIDSIFARLACSVLGIKIVQTVHDYDFQASLIIRLLTTICFKITDLSIFVSNVQKQYYLKKYKIPDNNKTDVVYNGIRFEKFDSTPSSDNILTRLNIQKKGLLLGSVGNFVNGHDQMTICRFLALLGKKEVDFTFLFIGKRDLRNPHLFDDSVSFCRIYGLSDKVLFLGSRSDVPEILPRLDAFIYSSDHDTFGISVIEAIACGVPVFVNDWPVMREVTEDGQRAILYRSKDEHDLLAKFSAFLIAVNNFKSEAVKNKIPVREKFSIENHLFRLHSVYKMLMNN